MRALVLGVLLAAGCVPYPGLAPEEGPAPGPMVEGAFRALDAGASQLESLHFKVRGYGSQAVQETADVAEANYNRIMLDTNLYSFKPKGLYELVIFGNREEYLRKTGQPAWSGGVTVGNAIYGYSGSGLAPTLAHEMTHLVFFEFMGRMDPRHRWINEGLAVYEESKAMGPGSDIFASVRMQMRAQPLNMEQVINFVPASEKDRPVNLWYAQAHSMLAFMIERGGRIGFSQFLTSLRDGQNIDEALSRAFPAWRNLEEFEREWRKTL
jgi:hypothetical protein